MLRVSDKTKESVWKSINGLEYDFDRGVRHALFNIGKKLQSSARQSIIGGAKSGKLYRYKGRFKTSSASGEAPANRSGNLQKSIDFQVVGDKKIIFGAKAEYAGFLEIGTKKMKKRPFLSRAIKNNKLSARLEFKTQIGKEIR